MDAERHEATAIKEWDTVHEKHEQELRDSIQRLRDVGSSLGGTQAEDKKEIDRFIDDLEHHIADPEDSERRTRLAANLPELVRRFEEHHPAITDVLNSVSVILSNMGI